MQPKEQTISFLNEPTKLFVEYFETLINEEKITQEELAVAMGISESNPRVFLSRLRKGKSVAIPEILIAQKLFGLEPCSLFKKHGKMYKVDDDEFLSMVSEAPVEWKTILDILAERVKTLEAELNQYREPGNTEGRPAAGNLG